MCCRPRRRLPARRLIRFLRVIRLLTQLVSNGMYATLVMEVSAAVLCCCC